MGHNRASAFAKPCVGELGLHLYACCSDMYHSQPSFHSLHVWAKSAGLLLLVLTADDTVTA